MKKAFVALVFFIIAFVFFLGLAPRLFQLEKVRKTLTAQLSRSLASDVTIGEMHWVWLPLPHLTLVNTEISGSHFAAAVPGLSVYPHWRMIFGKRLTPEKITLENPDIPIHDTAFRPGETSFALPGRAEITVQNGRLALETPAGYEDILQTGSLQFSAINGRLTLKPRTVALALNASSPLGKNITLDGTYSFAEQKYQLSLDWQNIELHKYFRDFFENRIGPAPSEAGVSGTITGQGLRHIEASLRGTLPCLVVKPQDRETLLNCGFADLQVVKDGSRLRFDIKDLEIKDPGINLAGSIERVVPPPGDRKKLPASEPLWTIDLTGSDLDLAAIRETVLTLWHENRIVLTVCDIVLGGKALSAAYRFSGNVSDFRRLDAMVIKAEFLDSPIHVPGAELDLRSASGPIIIKDSVLTGTNLSGRLGNSYGSNGKLLLDLGKHRDRFRLDLDIKADLIDLPPILARLVKHDGFQRQLEKFHNVSGRASGSLSLGDTLHDIKTSFEVTNVELATGYEPLPDDIAIESGTLQYEPGTVAWQEVTGSLGNQEITSLSGKVAWNTGKPLLAIEDIRAKLEGASLLTMLQGFEMTRGKTKQAASALDGVIEVSGGALQGYALQPKSWEYSVDFATTGLSLASPLLPEPARSEKLAATVSNGEAVIHWADIEFLDQKFNLKGVLSHRLLEGWHGSIEYNGPLKEKLAGWVSSKGWFPENMQPHVPCTIENLKVRWKGQRVAVSGTILPGLSGVRMPMAKIDIENSPEHLQINELTFYTARKQGRMGLDFWRLSPHRLTLSWDGFVNAATIDALFHHSTFTGGSFSGAFKLETFADRPEDSSFEGILETENLRLKTDPGEQPIFIRNLDLTGIGSQLQIHTFTLDVGSETITGSGQFRAEKVGLDLDIALASSFLSNNSLTDLQRALRKTQSSFLGDYSEKEEGVQLVQGMGIFGRIGFDFESFEFSRDQAGPFYAKNKAPYALYDVAGDLQLAPDNAARMEIFSARLCGLAFRGSWYSDTSLGEQFHLSTPANEILQLETVLPCLGVQQDIVEGEFSLQADLQREADIWKGGSIHLHSSQGRILRLKTLASIFKLVNITDLFTVHVDSRGKRGFPFSQMDIDMHVKDDRLLFDRAIIRGEGLNLFGKGAIRMADNEVDMTLLVAPFKTFSNLISKVPLIGEPLMGEYGSRISIPVGVRGPIAEPTVVPLHPGAVGKEFFDLMKDTLILPYTILKQPLGADGKSDESSGDEREKKPSGKK
jgi:hypothetical protein